MGNWVYVLVFCLDVRGCSYRSFVPGLLEFSGFENAVRHWVLVHMLRKVPAGPSNLVLAVV